MAGISSQNAIKVPFHLLSPFAPIPMVSAKVNGQGPFEFIIDTGNVAEPVLLSENLAKRLNLSGRPRKDPSFAVDIDASMSLCTVDSLLLGDASTGPWQAGITPALGQLADRLKINIDGNVGYGFFKDKVLRIDYARSTLRMDDVPAGDGAVSFTVSQKDALIVVPVEANGQPMRFVLDTGASATCISREAAKELGLKEGNPIDLNHGGKPNGYLSSLDSLSLDGKRQEKVFAVVADFVGAMSDKLGFPVDGVIGYNFLRHYVLTIDYPGKKIALAESTGPGS